MKAVILTTKHRGVFFGYVPDDQDMNAPSMGLQGAKMAIYWGTTKGIMQLAETGPTDKSKISAPADIAALHDITAVFAVSPKALKAWERA